MHKSLDPAIQSHTGAAISPIQSPNKNLLLKESDVLIDIHILNDIIKEAINQTTQPGTVVDAFKAYDWLKKYKVVYEEVHVNFIIISRTVIKHLMVNATGEIKLVFLELNKKIEVTKVSYSVQHVRKEMKSVPKAFGLSIALVASKVPKSLIEGKVADAVGEGVMVTAKFFLQEYIAKTIAIKSAKRVVLQASARLILASTINTLGGAAALAAFSPAVGVIGVIAIGIAVGTGIEMFDKHFKLTEKVIKVSRKIGDNLSDLYKILVEEGGLKILDGNWENSEIIRGLKSIQKMNYHDWEEAFAPGITY
ncbi:hypothetical protein [uncultured Aquimarina sp.]|uniref:hypothetical protein n=1 Tax=uncultured Aquimarina sp. TaxID=575652 RepID=UPI00261F3DC7|nr:hypothetical protein [uncultured Aquimarina sp.]